MPLSGIEEGKEEEWETVRGGESVEGSEGDGEGGRWNGVREEMEGKKESGGRRRRKENLIALTPYPISLKIEPS